MFVWFSAMPGDFELTQHFVYISIDIYAYEFCTKEERSFDVYP